MPKKLANRRIGSVAGSPQPALGPDSDVTASLMAVTPIDGRYRRQTRSLERFFSEFALIRYRVKIELEWYLSLAENPSIDALAPLDNHTKAAVAAIHENFSLDDAIEVKEFESVTNHDVKAVEYFVKEKIKAVSVSLPVEMVHFACTSEDINNLAYALLLKDYVDQELQPKLDELLGTLSEQAHRYSTVVMLSLTHGQNASPTTVGKEFAIFAARLQRQMRHLKNQEYLGKMNGAVGNFNAHQFAYPNVDWLAHSKSFVESLGLVWNPLTTQIESHDFLAELFDTMVRIDTVLLDLTRDLWGYVSLGYFKQRVVAGEVGSSVMPHKVNPIDFENCEGNLGIATALLQHLATKLPVSRWQRDLSDSTALRSIGSAFGHAAVALAALKRGLGRIDLDEEAIKASLSDPQSWEVVAEGIQTLMRRSGMARPYETLKELTRGRAITQETIDQFVRSLPLDKHAKDALKRLSPQNYVGLAAALVERFAPKRHNK
jgi:adenylosuccinate lyase